MEKAIYKTLCLILLLLSLSGFSQDQTNINGQVLYHYSYPMGNVTANLYDLDGDLIGSTITAPDGTYSFLNVPDEDYTIEFSTTEPAGGVNLQDAFYVLLYLLNLYSFDEIQQLAADVNGSGSVNWIDYSMILIGYLNQGNPFPVGDWVFEPVTVTAGARSGLLSGSSSSGDINGTYIPTKSSESFLLSQTFQQILTTPEKSATIGITSIGLTEITGLHLIFRIPEGMDITGIETGLRNVRHSLHGQELRITWMSQDPNGVYVNPDVPLISVLSRINNHQNSEKSYALQLMQGSHMTGPEGEILSGASLVIPTLTMMNLQEITVSAYPNPFRGQATLNYQLEQEGQVVIRLFDQAGRMVSEVSNTYHAGAGTYQAVIDGNSLLPGMYHYAISVSGEENIFKSGSVIKSK